MILSLGLLLFAGCEKETTKGDRYVKYYPAVSLVDGDVIYNAKGEEYREPGVVATFMGEDVSESVVVTGSVNTEVEGIYYKTYTCTVEDGTTVVLTRTIVVGDAGTSMPDISGDYTTTVTRTDAEGTAVKAADLGYTQPFPETLKLVEGAPNNYYEINDLISGWYQSRFNAAGDPALVSKTNCKGIILIATDGTIFLAKAYPDNYWFTTPLSLSANKSIGKWNSGTGVITIKTKWEAYTFDGVYTSVVN